MKALKSILWGDESSEMARTVETASRAVGVSSPAINSAAQAWLVDRLCFEGYLRRAADARSRVDKAVSETASALGAGPGCLEDAA